MEIGRESIFTILDIPYLFHFTLFRRGSWLLLDIATCGTDPTASLTSGESFCWMIQALVDPGPGSNVSSSV